MKSCDDIFGVLFLNVCTGIKKSPLDLIEFVEHPRAGHQASKGQEERNDHGDLAPEAAVEARVFQGGEVHQGGQPKGGYSRICICVLAPVRSAVAFFGWRCSRAKTYHSWVQYNQD